MPLLLSSEKKLEIDSQVMSARAFKTGGLDFAMEVNRHFLQNECVDQ